MNLSSFTFLPKSFLGIDIGTSTIKVVELSRWGSRLSLKNFGELKAEVLYSEPFRKFEKNSLVLSSKDIARAIRAIFQEAKITSKQAVLSLPDFSSFFTHFDLPPMTKEELPNAVQFEARKHIPLPLSEVMFDWQILENRTDEKQPFKILLVAVPKEVVNQYQEIANFIPVKLVGLEAEVFALIRSTFRQRTDKGVFVLLDIGAQSTTVNLIYKKTLRISHSVDIAGNHFTDRIAQSFSIDTEKAEEQKRAKGMLDKTFSDVLLPLVDLLCAEIQKIERDFIDSEGGKEVEKIILAGGSAMLPGLKEYVEKTLSKSTELANPFSTIFYPPVLEYELKETGGAYAVAVGAALRNLEKA